MARRSGSRNRVAWFIFVAVVGIVIGFLYHASGDLQTRIFSVVLISVVEGILRPRRWILTYLITMFFFLLTYYSAMHVINPFLSAQEFSLGRSVVTCLFSAAGGLLVGITGRKVFSSRNKRSTRD